MITFDPTYEVDFDGELGALVSLDAHGHLDDRDAEIFMATTVAEEVWETKMFGFEIEHLWRSEHPLPDYDDCARCTFEYTPEERDGAIAVTRFQIAHPWTIPGTDQPRMCARTEEHIEPAATGVPVGRFLNLDEIDHDARYVYLCREHADEFDERWHAALADKLAEMREA